MQLPLGKELEDHLFRFLDLVRVYYKQENMKLFKNYDENENTCI